MNSWTCSYKWRRDIYHQHNEVVSFGYSSSKISWCLKVRLFAPHEDTRRFALSNTYQYVMDIADPSNSRSDRKYQQKRLSDLAFSLSFSDLNSLSSYHLRLSVASDPHTVSRSDQIALIRGARYIKSIETLLVFYAPEIILQLLNIRYSIYVKTQRRSLTRIHSHI